MSGINRHQDIHDAISHYRYLNSDKYPRAILINPQVKSELFTELVNNMDYDPWDSESDLKTWKGVPMYRTPDIETVKAI